MSWTLSEDKIRQNVVDYVRCRFERIEVHPGDGMFNFQCFNNAVQIAKGTDIEVYEVFYVANKQVILHYVNYYPETNLFLDNTLGYQTTELEYYMIRRIPEIDYGTLDGEFDRAIKYWNNKFSNKFQRRLLNISRLV